MDMHKHFLQWQSVLLHLFDSVNTFTNEIVFLEEAFLHYVQYHIQIHFQISHEKLQKQLPYQLPCQSWDEKEKREVTVTTFDWTVVPFHTTKFKSKDSQQSVALPFDKTEAGFVSGF